MSKPPKRVEVRWLDACSSEEEPLTTFGCVCYEIGYLVEKNSDGIRIASQWSFGDHDEFIFHGFTDIPKGIIEKVRFL